MKEWSINLHQSLHSKIINMHLFEFNVLFFFLYVCLTLWDFQLYTQYACLPTKFNAAGVMELSRLPPISLALDNDHRKLNQKYYLFLFITWNKPFTFDWIIPRAFRGNINMWIYELAKGKTDWMRRDFIREFHHGYVNTDYI